MSDSEKFEAQGRAYAALKEVKSNVDTAGAALHEHARRFGDAKALIERFVADPNQKNESYISPSEHLKTTIGQLEIGAVAQLVDELKAESVRIAQLQEQIAKF